MTEPKRGGAVYILLSFWAAFLLFSIQPIISKLLLPLFGGAAAVWLVNLVFFTGFLLLGYLYAHYLILKLEPKWQIIIHFAVVVAAGLGAFYEFSVFQDSWPALKRQVLDNFNFPVLTLLAVLLKTIGLPYFVLATTSPIIQAWYGRAGLGEPYKLYSISNVGSLLAIALYPFVLEPWLAVTFQARSWLVGFLLFILLLAAAARKFLKMSSAALKSSAVFSKTAEPRELISLKTKLIWLGLALLPAMMLLTVTTRLIKSIAAVPFLWLLPLAVYLLTFIICFSPREKITAKFYAFVFVVLAALLGFFNFLPVHFLFLILAEVLVFGAAAMLCHTKLYESRPEINQLTLYYLYISLGGALGTALVALIAPVVFSGYYEYGLVLGAVLVLALFLTRKEIRELYGLFKRKTLWLALLILLAALLNLFNIFITGGGARGEIVSRSRNFFGTLEVKKVLTVDGEVVRLVNGNILHGAQMLAPEKSSLPTSYYSEDSGAGLALRAKQKISRAERVGVVGLGAGTMAAYCRPGDSYTFYDINPAVVEIANRNFFFLSQCRERGGEVRIKIGDARLVLERELREAGAESYDILILDAFSDDAIPVHLLTREAMKIFLERLSPDGILAVHISNRYLNLKPVLKRLAEEYELNDAVVENFKSDRSLEETGSVWVLLTKDKNILADEPFKEAERLKKEKDIRPWTDQFNNLLPLIK